MEDKISQNPEGKSGFAKYLFDWVQSVAIAVVVVILMFTFIGRTSEVNGESMYPTLNDGDRLVVSNVMYTPAYGDIVVFSKLTFKNGQQLVKRVIATEGQTVDIDASAGTVTVDGQVLDEEYINEPIQIQRDISFPLTVPEGYVFVMGDNRNNSTDSRSSSVGLVDTREIIGHAKAVMLPFSHFEIF